jgi:hypothetical protein
MSVMQGSSNILTAALNNITPRSKSNALLTDKIKNNLFSFNTINLLFSKFSSETYMPVQKTDLYLFTYKSSQKIKESNKKINFNCFLKILICISNKLFNPKYNSANFESLKDCNLDILLNGDSKTLQQYFELFIGNYIRPCYNEIKPFIEKESYDLLLLDKVLKDNYINEFFQNINLVLYKMFKVYTEQKDKMCLNEFYKFVNDFEIFPDLIAKPKVIHLFINFVNDFDQNNVIEGNPDFSIEFDSFIGILIFIAVGSKLGSDTGSDLDLLRRILHFFQRMVQSKGLKNVVIYSGSSK